MKQLSIIGGRPLEGSVPVAGAKNAALPLLMATLLTEEQCVLRNVPDLEDISVTLRLLRALGSEAEHHGDMIKIRTPEISGTEARYALVKALRASFWVLGPLLARAGSAKVALPGGDAIGTRPVDLHLKGLSQMGADIEMRHGVLYAAAPEGLRPANIHLDYPSVGATHHLLMAASLVPGETTISGVAQEPEVVQLAQFLTAMGATVEGAGTEHVTVHGVSRLGGAACRIIGDRIEAATYLAATAMCGGSVEVRGIHPEAFQSTLDVLRAAGCEVEAEDEKIRLRSNGRLRAVSFSTAPYPGVATDVQPLLLAMMCVADGTSAIQETVFENRFGHVADFRRFGAEIRLDGRTAFVTGVPRLSGAPADARDIRAAAGLVLLGLAADGETRISETHHLERGYERMIEKFRALGGNVSEIFLDDSRELVCGC